MAGDCLDLYTALQLQLPPKPCAAQQVAETSSLSMHLRLLTVLPCLEHRSCHGPYERPLVNKWCRLWHVGVLVDQALEHLSQLPRLPAITL